MLNLGSTPNSQTMSEETINQTTPTPNKIVHLITQRNQPYGSVRRCCELCGAYGKIDGKTHFYVVYEEEFNELPEGYVRCNDRTSE